MQTLWAPWRMEYIEKESKDKKTGCLFCPQICGEQDADNQLVYHGPLTAVCMNKFPYANGHTLVLPNRHVGELDDLDEKELFALFDTVRLTRKILQQVMDPDGYNIGLNIGKVAGAGIPEHLHVHIVPRWEGDHNFMPVLADVKVIPEHLEKTREKLARAFDELAGKE